MSTGHEVKIDWKQITEKNKANVKATKDGGTVSIIAAGKLVLIGSGHKSEYLKLAKEGNGKEGKVQVDKGSVLDKGELILTGPLQNRAEIQDAIKLFSKKKIIFK